ncbi:unnamed protein product [Periconia digitata]|uniref:Zn(2)-C6 fungal-type domain-containing protein n=1 Tax=Periconia digitata TaxID=1303443 RepID=A0A9W4UAZ1_9PLEO|nr:unnamed protein product [Periconia digitata]
MRTIGAFAYTQLEVFSSTLVHDLIISEALLDSVTLCTFRNESPPMAEPKTGRRRRAHGKSRNGCVACKRRRIKCDEEKSGCGYCVRRGAECVYAPWSQTRASAGCQQPTPPATTSSTAASVASPSGNAVQTPPPRLSPAILSDDAELGTSFRMNDLTLLHHWSVVTSLSLVNTPGVDHIWQTVMVQVGTRNPYVMQGIFSLTALHLAYLDPANKHTLMAAAAQYHNRALRDFQARICDVDQHDSDALLASASINIFYVIAAFGKLYHGDAGESSASRRAHMLGEDWIALVRGVNRLLLQIGDRVRAGPLSSLLSLANWEDLDPDTIAFPHDAALQSLRSTWADAPDAPVYDESLYLLRKCWAWTTQFRHSPGLDALPQPASHPDWGYNRSWSAPFIWLSLAPDGFFLRLQQRQPPALLLFAHFGGLSAGLQQYWWMEGWGKNMVVAAAETLGSYWHVWMELPWRLVAASCDDD